MALYVVKIGGALLDAEGATDAFWEALLRLRADADLVLIHGGGPHATRVAQRLGHTPRMIHGRRVTTDLDLEIVQWTLRGSLNVRLVGQAIRHGLRGIGVSGADDGMIRVTRRPPREIDGELVDFGWVGDVEEVDVSLLRLLIEAGRLPIVAPMGVDARGLLYNVNADTVAAGVAGALQADRFYFVAESGGVRRDATDPDTQLDRCTRADFEAGIREGWVTDGMRVKLDVAFQALDAGVREVVVLAPVDLLTGSGGTRIVSDPA